MTDDENDVRGVATQSTATAAVKAAEKLGAFLSQVFGSPIETSVGMLQDKLSVVRWERQLRLADRVREITSERAKTGKPVPVPPRLALPIIESAALEDNDYLQDLWAYLLSSAMNSETSITVRSAFIDIIKNLEPVDVKILEYCYMRYRKIRTERIAKSKESPWHSVGDSVDYPVSMDDIRGAMELSEPDYKTAIDNLIRTRLLASYIQESEIQSNVDGSEHWFEASLHYGYYSVCMTHLGISFVVACTGALEDEGEREFMERLRKADEVKKNERDAAIQAALKKIEERFGGTAVIQVEAQSE